MSNHKCVYYHDGVCEAYIRISGMFHVEPLEIGLCSSCDALTEDEIEALCDKDIMGFSLSVGCYTCKRRYARTCKAWVPSCNCFTNYWKWEPKTEGP